MHGKWRREGRRGGRREEPAVEGAGHGIAGMRERVAAIGGRLEAGFQAPVGFRVRAELPWDAS